MTDDYTRRAIEHRPQSLEDVRATVRRMLSEGMSDYGIAACLGLAVEMVRRLAVYDECQGYQD